MYDLIEAFRTRRQDAKTLVFCTDITSAVEVPTSWEIMRLTSWFNTELRQMCGEHCVKQNKPLNGYLRWEDAGGWTWRYRFVLTFDVGADFPWCFEFEDEPIRLD